MLRIVDNEPEGIDDQLLWDADNLIDMGYIKDFDHWLEFSDYMSRHALAFFENERVNDGFI